MSYGTGLTRWIPRINFERSTQPNVLHVAIGRNVGDQPMDDTDWYEFRRDVTLAIGDTVGEPDFIVVGSGGSWEDVAEASAIFTVLNPTLTSSLDRLRVELQQIATRFRQDAIAVTVGNSELVES